MARRKRKVTLGSIAGLVATIAVVAACGPAPRPGLSPAIDVAVGQGTSCALTETKGVWCWGRGDQGALGTGTSANVHPKPVEVAGIDDAVDLEATAGSMCAVVADRTVRCWGSNQYGQLGAGSALMGDRSFVPVQVAGLSDVVRLSGGASHICALVEDGTVWCWGRSARGEIGNGTIGVSDVPVKVEGLSDVRDISAGSDHTCAALDDGTVWCWGDNIEGQIGNGTESLEVVATPTRVPGLDSVRSLDASDRTTCSLLEDTTVRCWGSGRSGELGNGVSGANYRSYVPVPVLDLTGVVQMTLASGRGCAVLDDGTARCWGNDSQGRLGKGTIGQHSSVPIEVSGLVGAVQIAGSPFAAHSCARLGSGGLRCWGHNVHGQVGNGLYGWEHSAPSPVAVSRFY